MEQTPIAETRPPGNAFKIAKEWPPLPNPTANHQDNPTPQTHLTPPADDKDETQAQTDTSTDSRTEKMTVELYRSSTTRKKKLQADKKGDNTQERKWKRTITSTLPKGKY